MWQPIETAPPGLHLLYFPPQVRDVSNEVVLGQMIRYDRYPVGYPRKPTLWMAVEFPEKQQPVPYFASNS